MKKPSSTCTNSDLLVFIVVGKQVKFLFQIGYYAKQKILKDMGDSRIAYLTSKMHKTLFCCCYSQIGESYFY